MDIAAMLKRSLICLLLLLLLPSQGTASDAEPLTFKSFSTLPNFKNVRISPDGEKIIYSQNVKDSTVLAAQDLDTGKVTPLAVADNEKMRLRFAEWANNDTVLFSIAIPYYRSGVPTVETRLLVRKADASGDIRTLIKSGKRRTENQYHFPQFQDNIISLLPDDPNHILMGMDLKKQGLNTVYKTNLYTGHMEEIQPYKKDVRDWVADQQGRIRIGIKFNPFTTSLALLIYNLEKKEWKETWTTKVFSDVSAVEPIGFGKDPGILYVRADHNGRKAIFKVDVMKDDLPMELVASDDRYDINGGLIYRRKTRDAVGVYHNEADGTRIYWDEYFEKFQEAIDRALPDTINFLIDSSEDEHRYIVFSTNDTTPGKYYLGDRDRNTLKLIADDYPQLEGKLQSVREITYTARDGKIIEGYLTLPPNHMPGIPCPAVIYPHGGPMARDYRTFDYWAQFFARKGIVVLQPNFRGSSGYGREFEKYALQGFGLAMQDDLTDAAKWLIEQKLADPERIAIAGGSYGGYAALMGAVKTPDLFRCAISFAGISDLLILVKSRQPYLNYSVVLKQIGSNRKKLKAVSPVNHIDKIKIPILLAHGDEDRIVPVEQSQKMAKKLKKAKKVCTYIELGNGDHNLSLQRNRHKFFRAMDEFLNKYLLN